jgi:hypothetical protein
MYTSFKDQLEHSEMVSQQILNLSFLVRSQVLLPVNIPVV